MRILQLNVVEQQPVDPPNVYILSFLIDIFIGPIFHD